MFYKLQVCNQCICTSAAIELSFGISENDIRLEVAPLVTTMGGNGKIVELEPPGKVEMCLFALKGKGECEPNKKRNQQVIARVFF